MRLDGTEDAKAVKAPERRRMIGVPPAFRYPKYRVYWLGFFLSVAGHQMFQFLQFVLVHELTGSVVDLGVLGVANAVPAILLGVIGGVFADRWDKRQLIIVTQAAPALSMVVLATLTITGNVELWHVLMVAMVVSGVGAFDGPARSAYYPRLIEPSAMISAVALNSTIWQSTRIVGPAIAGVIVGSIADVALDGIGVTLYLAASGSVAMIAAVLWIRVPGPGESKGNPMTNLLEGLSYIRANSMLFTLILMAFASALFGWSYIVLMPVFAQDILGVGKSGQGMLLASAGVGATAVTVALAVLDAPLLQRRGWFVIVGAISNGVLLVGFALTSELVGSFPLAMVFMFGLGTTQMLYTTGTMGSIQLSVDDRVRGRVLGVYGIVWGIQPLSGTQAAFVSQFFGVAVAVALGGVAIIAMAVIAAAVNPSLRQLRTDPPAEE
jgi:predicted MFS family arabinose efflux permease